MTYLKMVAQKILLRRVDRKALRKGAINPKGKVMKISGAVEQIKSQRLLPPGRMGREKMINHLNRKRERSLLKVIISFPAGSEVN